MTDAMNTLTKDQTEEPIHHNINDDVEMEDESSWINVQGETPAFNNKSYSLGG